MKVVKQDGKRKMFIMSDGSEIPFSEFSADKNKTLDKAVYDKALKGGDMADNSKSYFSKKNKKKD